MSNTQDKRWLKEQIRAWREQSMWTQMSRYYAWLESRAIFNVRERD